MEMVSDHHHAVSQVDNDGGEQPEVNQPLLPSIRRRGRLLDRDADFSQSRGRWNIHPRHAARLRRQPMAKIFWDHWFYHLSYQRTPILMLILFCTYTILVILYASMYLMMSRMGGQETHDMDTTGKTTTFCNMGISSFMEALYFSLSTMTTIGYGVSDYYFGGCWTPLVVVLMQVFTAVTFDAVSVGLIFQRFSRGHKRSKTILVSSASTVLRVQGDIYWMFRVAELRKQALLQTSVRAFLVYTDRRKAPNGDMETNYCVTKPLPLQNESHGILMSLPQILCHKVDETSPLRPPNPWWDARGESHVILPSSMMDFAADSHNLEQYWADRDIEIIVTVEGTDELTGALIQARHSFTYEDDIQFHRRFVPCVDADATVNFARFQETEPAADDYPDGYAHIV